MSRTVDIGAVAVHDPAAPTAPPWATWSSGGVLGPPPRMQPAVADPAGGAEEVRLWAAPPSSGRPVLDPATMLVGPLAGPRHDVLGLRAHGQSVPVPLGPDIAVALTVAVADAAGAVSVPVTSPEVHRFVLEGGWGTSRLVRAASTRVDGGGVLRLEVAAPRAELLRWLHDGALLGHLLTAGTARVEGDLMALSLVDGWVWFHREVVGTPPDPVRRLLARLP